MSGWLGGIGIGVAALSLLGVGAARAEEDKPAPEAPPIQADTPREEKPKEAAAGVTANKDGFAIQAEDGSFRLKIAGYAQADGRFYAGDDANAAVDTFVLRRVRPIVSGTVGKYFDFNITPDFGGGVVVVQDAFLDARFSDAFRVKAGKFKGPVGLERLHSGAALTFVERGLPTDIVPNREIGIQFHGELGGGVLYYQAGVFDGVVDGGSTDLDTSDKKDLEGRVFLQPFRNSSSEPLRGLGIGIAATSGDQLGAVPSYRTIGQLTFFSYGSSVVADGKRTRIAPQASYQSGPVRVFGEWVSSRQRLRKSATDSRDVTNKAWQGVVSVVVSGEAPAAGVVTPKRPWDRSKGGWGAFELAARYGELDVDADIFAEGYADPARSASKARSWGVGLNWYVTRSVKYVLNYDRTTFDGGAAAGAARKAEHAVLLRAQVGF